MWLLGLPKVLIGIGCSCTFREDLRNFSPKTSVPRNFVKLMSADIIHEPVKLGLWHGSNCWLCGCCCPDFGRPRTSPAPLQSHPRVFSQMTDIPMKFCIFTCKSYEIGLNKLIIYSALKEIWTENYTDTEVQFFYLLKKLHLKRFIKIILITYTAQITMHNFYASKFFYYDLYVKISYLHIGI